MITPLIAAIIIGSFWTGVGATAVIANNNNDRHTETDLVIAADVTDDDHVAACKLKYRSYNEETNLFLSYSGEWKPCVIYVD